MRFVRLLLCLGVIASPVLHAEDVSEPPIKLELFQPADGSIGCAEKLATRWRVAEVGRKLKNHWIRNSLVTAAVSLGLYAGYVGGPGGLKNEIGFRFAPKAADRLHALGLEEAAGNNHLRSAHWRRWRLPVLEGVLLDPRATLTDQQQAMSEIKRHSLLQPAAPEPLRKFLTQDADPTLRDLTLEMLNTEDRADHLELLPDVLKLYRFARATSDKKLTAHSLRALARLHPLPLEVFLELFNELRPYGDRVSPDGELESALNTALAAAAADAHRSGQDIATVPIFQRILETTDARDGRRWMNLLSIGFYDTETMNVLGTKALRPEMRQLAFKRLTILSDVLRLDQSSKTVEKWEAVLANAEESLRVEKDPAVREAARACAKAIRVNLAKRPVGQNDRM